MASASAGSSLRAAVAAAGERGGLHQSGLAPLDLAGKLDDADVRQAGPPGDQFGKEPALALEQSRFRCSPVSPPSPQLAERQGVEGPGRDRLGWCQAVQTLAQLARRLAGEGDRESRAQVGQHR